MTNLIIKEQCKVLIINQHQRGALILNQHQRGALILNQRQRGGQCLARAMKLFDYNCSKQQQHETKNVYPAHNFLNDIKNGASY